MVQLCTGNADSHHCFMFVCVCVNGLNMKLLFCHDQRLCGTSGRWQHPSYVNISSGPKHPRKQVFCCIKYPQAILYNFKMWCDWLKLVVVSIISAFAWKNVNVVGCYLSHLIFQWSYILKVKLCVVYLACHIQGWSWYFGKYWGHEHKTHWKSLSITVPPCCCAKIKPKCSAAILHWKVCMV